jgi:multidrug efflux system outer membrane protein
VFAGMLGVTFFGLFFTPVFYVVIRKFDALAANHDLRIAQARLGETRASRRAALSDLFPVVTATGKRDRSKRSPEEMPGAPADQLRGDFYDVGFDASWEVSLFGRGMRGVQAQNAFRDAAIANLWGTQVAVTAEVARNYFELRGLQARRDVVLKNADGQKAALDIARASVDAGRSSELDLQRAIAQYESTLATVPRIDTAITRTSYRIAVLTGRTPQALEERLAAVEALPALPDLVPVGTPADLLRRRPDILAAERELAGRSAMIGYRLAELFPRVFFLGGVGTAATGSGDLGDSGTGRWSFAPQLQWAAFDLPRVLANVGVERARHEAAIAGLRTGRAARAGRRRRCIACVRTECGCARSSRTCGGRIRGSRAARTPALRERPDRLPQRARRRPRPPRRRRQPDPGAYRSRHQPDCRVQGARRRLGWAASNRMT